jgi:hypothetical protein
VLIIHFQPMCIDLHVLSLLLLLFQERSASDVTSPESKLEPGRSQRFPQHVVMHSERVDDDTPQPTVTSAEETSTNNASSSLWWRHLSSGIQRVASDYLQLHSALVMS